MSTDFVLDKVKRQAYIRATVTPDTFKAAMDDAGIETQREAAVALGVTEGAVSLWLSGKRPIPPMAVMALSEVRTRRVARTAQAQRKTRNGRTRKTSTLKG